MSKETRLAVRRAQRLRSIGRELIERLDRDPAPKVAKARPTEDAEEVAQAERGRLGVDIDEQYDWRSPHEAFETWRYAVENRNVLVFRFSMPIADARGFSLTEGQPFAVVVNSADAVHARIFTLFHEYGHLVLRRQGICIPEGIVRRKDQTARIESWCNQFAAALLVPKDAFLGDRDLQALVRSKEFSDAHLARVSARFRVSRQVILRRMLSMELIGVKEYSHQIRKLQVQARRPKPSGGFGLPPAKRSFAERGHLFTSLVMDGRQRDFINFRDVSDYLALGVKHLDQLSALMGI